MARYELLGVESDAKTQRDKMEQRQDWLADQIYDIKQAIYSGSYPNWYPATLQKFESEWKSLVFSLAR